MHSPLAVHCLLASAVRRSYGLQRSSRPSVRQREPSQHLKVVWIGPSSSPLIPEGAVVFSYFPNQMVQVSVSRSVTEENHLSFGLKSGLGGLQQKFILCGVENRFQQRGFGVGSVDACHPGVSLVSETWFPVLVLVSRPCLSPNQGSYSTHVPMCTSWPFQAEDLALGHMVAKHI